MQLLMFASAGYVAFFFFLVTYFLICFSPVVMFSRFPIAFNLCKYLGTVLNSFQKCISVKFYL